MEYKEIRDLYLQKRNDAKKLHDELDTQRETLLEQAIHHQHLSARKMTEYHRVTDRMNTETHVSWVQELVVPLVLEINRRTGLNFETSDLRTFGLRAECPVFHKGETNESDEPTYYSLVFTPQFIDGGITLYLDTGKVSRRCDPGSISELNGFNNITTQVSSVEDVLQVLRDKYSDIEFKNNKTD